VIGQYAIATIALVAVPAAGFYGRVDNPAPQIQFVSPGSLSPRTSGTEVTITGKNFVSTSIVTFNGLPRTAALVDSSHLTLVLRPMDVADPGTFPIVVTNPPPGGGTATTHLTVKPINDSR
jgi:hypothetical protein